MTLTPDVKKFCFELYETLHNVESSLASSATRTAQDLRRAVIILKNHWQESTEGRQFVHLGEKERASLENDITRLYASVEKKTPLEVLTVLAELYTQTARIQPGHLLTTHHAKKMMLLGETFREVPEFKSLSPDVRASIEVAEARFHSGEMMFASELKIWWNETMSNFDTLVKKLTSTDRAVVGSALTKARKKISLEFARGIPETKLIEEQMHLLQHEISELIHKRGGEKSILEADPKSILIELFEAVKDSVEELKLFIKSGRVKL